MGREGKLKDNLRLANFREQYGIYILYGHYGVFYVGIATAGSLGNRLLAHNDNYAESQWNRLSWFGFRKVLSRTENGIAALGEMPQGRYTDPIDSIKDLESLLIRAMVPSGQRVETFTYEERWEQVGSDDIDYYLDELC